MGKPLLLALLLVTSACTSSADSPLDGTWTVSLSILLPGSPQDDDPTVRTFTFSSDCTEGTCTTTGVIESADGRQEVVVAQDGDDYRFGFHRTATWAPDGEPLCMWESAMEYRVRAVGLDELGHAVRLEGELVETPRVVLQADGVDCSAPPFVSLLTATPAQ